MHTSSIFKSVRKKLRRSLALTSALTVVVAGVAAGCGRGRPSPATTESRSALGAAEQRDQLRSVAQPPPPLVTVPPSKVGPRQPENVALIK